VLSAEGGGVKILVAHPGASWATADVEAGLSYGLQAHGVEVIPYRLDVRISHAKDFLNSRWRKARKTNPAVVKPTHADVMYQASIGLLDKALRFDVDAVLVVSAMFLHPDVLIMLRRAKKKTFILFTESPYDLEKELAVAALVDGAWTNERSVVPAFRAVNPNSFYLPHAWHPDVHQPSRPGDDDVPQHDVVFVGTAFTERIEWFSAIDWTGIDLGLYGSWSALGPKHKLRRYVREGVVGNDKTSALYRRAKVGLNLYRSSMGWGRFAPRISHAESLSPRAYELAACGAFHLSDFRAEVPETFGDLVPTFRTPTEAAALIRLWLADAAGRERVAAQLPACVAESSWVQRAHTVIGDLHGMLRADEPAIAVGVGG
jgi:spore maturation protein CgeB